VPNKTSCGDEYIQDTQHTQQSYYNLRLEELVYHNTTHSHTKYTLHVPYKFTGKPQRCSNQQLDVFICICLIYALLWQSVSITIVIIVNMIVNEIIRIIIVKQSPNWSTILIKSHEVQKKMLHLAKIRIISTTKIMYTFLFCHKV